MNLPNDPKNEPTNPIDTAWEAAMSRDFDARVRDLHEAPLDIDSVKGKAHQIRRNRRAAVAGGIIGVAAIVTPFAVLASNGNTDSKEPPAVDNPTEKVDDPSETINDPVTTSPDYVVGGVWHQADGDEITLPEQDRAYDSAVLWNDQLVATYFGGEVYSVTDVIDADGKVVDTFDTAGSVAVNEAGTTIAWVGTDGEIMTAWDGDQVSIGTVDLAAAGETVAWSVAAVTGGPNCYEVEDGCQVFVNSALGEESRAFDSHGINDIVAPGVTKVFDATDAGVVTVINEVTDDLNTCGGPLDQVDGTLRWTTCDYQVHQVSPDGSYIAASPSQYDGLGPSSVSVLDADTGKETGRYGSEGFIGTWAWTTDSQLLFDAYDGASWHLFSMDPATGEFTELGDPVKGDEFSPYTLIQH